MLESIAGLASDDVAWIRFSIAVGLPNLEQGAPDLMWRLLDELAARENHDGVLRGVARTAWVLRRQTDRAVGILEKLADRIRPSDRRESALEATTTVAGLIYVVVGSAAAHDVFHRLVDYKTYGGIGVRVRPSTTYDRGAHSHRTTTKSARTLGLCSELVTDAIVALPDGSEELDDEQRARAEGRVGDPRRSRITAVLRHWRR